MGSGNQSLIFSAPLAFFFHNIFFRENPSKIFVYIRMNPCEHEHFLLPTDAHNVKKTQSY